MRKPSATKDARETLVVRVLRYVHRRAVFHAGERALVAVSGGADSTALLLLLARLRDRLGIELAAAHFDHMLRGEDERAGDRAFVEELCGELGVGLALGSGDVRAYGVKSRMGLEEAARELRYQFFSREATRIGAGVVATGHTQDDLAETVLMHMLRGSGLDGMIGMRPRSAWPFGEGPELARPLLAVSRRETERYCRESKIEPRMDPTNEETVLTRNRVRHIVMPGLREINPRASGAISRLAESLAIDAEYLKNAADEVWRRLAKREGPEVSFDRSELSALPTALKVRLLRRAAREVAAAGVGPEGEHLERAIEIVDQGRGELSIPGGLSVVADNRRVRVMRGRPRLAPGIDEMELATPGVTEFDGWRVEAFVGPGPREPRLEDKLEAWLDTDAIGRRLTVRSRRRGDRLRPLGMNGEKKVQDILVDAKTPVEERDSTPIVCGMWGIAWLVGHCIDERAAVREGSRDAVHLRFSRRGTAGA